MKTKDIASKYDFDQYKLEKFIDKQNIKCSKSGLGGIIVDDQDVNTLVESFIQHNRELTTDRELKRNDVAKKVAYEQDRAAKEAIEKEERKSRTVEQCKQLLVKQGYDSYCEYKVVSILDEKSHTNTAQTEKLMNYMGLDGWRLRAATTNELGKNSLGISLEGLEFGPNSTVNETILYFERQIPLR